MANVEINGTPEDLGLYKTFIDGQVQIFSLSREKMSEIETAVAKKNGTAVLEEKMKQMDTEYNNRAAKEKKAHDQKLSQINQEFKTQLSSITLTADQRSQLEQKYKEQRSAEIESYNQKRDKLEAEYQDKREKKEKQLSDQRKIDEQNARQIASKLAKAEYDQLNIYQRQHAQQKLADDAKQYAQQLNLRKQVIEASVEELNAAKEKTSDVDEQEEIERRINELWKERDALADEESKFSAQSKAASEEASRLSVQTQAALLAAAEKGRGAASSVHQQLSKEFSDTEARIAELTVNRQLAIEAKIDTSEIDQELDKLLEDKETLEINVHQAKESAHKEELSSIKSQNISDMVADKLREKELEHARNDKEAEANWQMFTSPAGMQNALKDSVAKAVENIGAKISEAVNQIDQNIDAFYQYQASVEARLQGSELHYADMLDKVSSNVGFSGYVSQKAVIENIKKASDEGIAYNLELRAFLATVSDKIVTTFNAFDSNLLRLIRLQQADTTAARMGMEATLTRFLNEQYQDTSYLNDVYDNVSAAIIDANSQLTRDASIEFEYQVQKWLGSLYSLGMDQNTVSTIAQGLNYLGTGNVEALNGNDQLQSLFAMAAARGGLSYADILTGGLDGETTNKLLASMVDYLKEIALNSDNNQVTKSAYSNVFGFNISDLTAVQSLDTSSIMGDVINYSQAVTEVENQLAQLPERVHLSQVLSTSFENILLSAATDIGGNAGVYGMWKVLNVVEDLTGGIAIPAISVMGNMVDLHQTVTGLAKAGMAGLSLMGNILSGLFSGNLFGSNDLSDWGFEEFTDRGRGIKAISKGTQSGFSSSSELGFVGSASMDDTKNATMNDAADSADEDAKITNKNVEDEKDVYYQIRDGLWINESTTLIGEFMKFVELFNTFSDTLFHDSTNGINADRVFAADMNLDEYFPANRLFYSAIVSLPEDNTARIGVATQSSDSILGRILGRQKTLAHTVEFDSDIKGSELSFNSIDSVYNVLTNALYSNYQANYKNGQLVSSGTSWLSKVQSSLNEFNNSFNQYTESISSTIENTSSGITSLNDMIGGKSTSVFGKVNNNSFTNYLQNMVTNTAGMSNSILSLSSSKTTTDIATYATQVAMRKYSAQSNWATQDKMDALRVSISEFSDRALRDLTRLWKDGITFRTEDTDKATTESIKTILQDAIKDALNDAGTSVTLSYDASDPLYVKTI